MPGVIDELKSMAPVMAVPGNMGMRPLIGVAAIVIKDKKVLLGKRKNAHGAETWAFPGGHLEYRAYA